MAFRLLALLLSVGSAVMFVGVTGLTLGTWIVGRNDATNPVLDLGFFALGAVIVATGYLVQLWAPDRNVAGIQQAAIGLVSLGLAGWIGRRVEPLVGSLVMLAATWGIAALHPSRRTLFVFSRRPSPLLVGLSLLAAVPAAGYAIAMLAAARLSGPSCFLGRCARGDRLAEMAALAIAIVLSGLLAALKPTGWRICAWSASLAAILLGTSSIVLTRLPGALDPSGGMATVAWALLFLTSAEWEFRRDVDGRDGR